MWLLLLPQPDTNRPPVPSNAAHNGSVGSTSFTAYHAHPLNHTQEQGPAGAWQQLHERNRLLGEVMPSGGAVDRAVCVQVGVQGGGF